VSARPALLLALATALLGGAARAHTEKFPKRDRLTLRPDGATLVLDYAIPQGSDARALREIFDRDRSGALDPPEVAALTRYLADQATHFVKLTLDDQPVALARGAPEPDLSPGFDGRLGVRVTLTARFSLGGRHRLQFADRHKDRRLAVPLELAFDRVVPESHLPPLPLLDEKTAIDLVVSAAK